jgi:hypothetical protein
MGFRSKRGLSKRILRLERLKSGYFLNIRDWVELDEKDPGCQLLFLL